MAQTLTRQLTLACSCTGLEAVPDRVHLLPAGEVWGFDGRGPYRLDDPSAVIAASQALIDAGQARIDYGHAAWIGADQGAGAENAGFLTDLDYIPPDQGGEAASGLWGTVRWTETARRKLAERAFTALSPVFEHDAEGRVLRLLGGGLTNKPNLPLTALAARTQGGSAGNGPGSQGGGGSPPPALHAAHAVTAHADTGQATPSPTAPEVPMALADQLARVFGLPDAASEDAIVTYARQLMDAFARADDCLDAVRNALALPHDTAPDQVATAVQSRSAGTADLAATVATLQAQVDTLLQEQVAGQVDRLIAGGRALPAERDTLIAMANRMPDHFRRLLQERPVVLPMGESRLGARPPCARNGGSGRNLDAGALALCSQLGIAPDAYAKTLAAETR